jgi:hypothetical protein
MELQQWYPGDPAMEKMIISPGESLRKANRKRGTLMR